MDDHPPARREYLYAQRADKAALGGLIIGGVLFFGGVVGVGTTLGLYGSRLISDDNYVAGLSASLSGAAAGLSVGILSAAIAGSSTDDHTDRALKIYNDHAATAGCVDAR